MTDAKGLMLALQTPKDGRKEEHRAFYANHHLPDVCSVAGALRGEYLALVEGGKDSPWSNAAIYWLDRDPAEFLTETQEQAGSGRWHISDTLEMQSLRMVLGEAITPRVISDHVADIQPIDRILLVVLLNAAPGKDAEFNDWYTNRHIPDVLDVPGVVAAQRFRTVSHPALPAGGFAYATVYEIMAGELAEAMRELENRAGTDRMVLSPHMSPGIYAAHFALEEISFAVGASA